MTDSYWLIQTESRVEIKVKGSRFIGESYFADSKDQSNQRLASVRKREHAATHHCWAYRCGISPNEECQYSDDGEPSGTAGKPIADAIKGSGVTNCIVIVTRYFGGTELGTGGLARAYADAASTVLTQSGKKECFLMSYITCDIVMAHYDIIARLAVKSGARMTGSSFAEQAVVIYAIRQSLEESFIASAVELTSGRIVIQKVERDNRHA